MTADPYQTLGIKRAASSAEIKTAYRRLARKYHPDLNGGSKTSEEKFKEIAAAYEILADDDRRKAYDASRYVPPTKTTVAGAGFSMKRETAVTIDLEVDELADADGDPIGDFDADWEPPA